MDRKQVKLTDFKRRAAETETRVSKLKSSLDSLKTFLRLLNTNFVKSMKQQNALLREQASSCERDFLREIETMRNNLGPQLNRLIARKDRESQEKL